MATLEYRVPAQPEQIETILLGTSKSTTIEQDLAENWTNALEKARQNAGLSPTENCAGTCVEVLRRTQSCTSFAVNELLSWRHAAKDTVDSKLLPKAVENFRKETFTLSHSPRDSATQEKPNEISGNAIAKARENSRALTASKTGYLWRQSSSDSAPQAKPREIIGSLIDQVIENNSRLLSYDFDNKVHQELHALNNIGGFDMVQDALEMLSEASHRTTWVHNWPAYLSTLLKKYRAENSSKIAYQ